MAFGRTTNCDKSCSSQFGIKPLLHDVSRNASRGDDASIGAAMCNSTLTGEVARVCRMLWKLPGPPRRPPGRMAGSRYQPRFRRALRDGDSGAGSAPSGRNVGFLAASVGSTPESRRGAEDQS